MDGVNPWSTGYLIVTLLKRDGAQPEVCGYKSVSVGATFDKVAGHDHYQRATKPRVARNNGPIRVVWRKHYRPSCRRSSPHGKACPLRIGPPAQLYL